MKNTFSEEQVICFKKELLTRRLGKPEVFYDEALWHNILDNLKSIPRSAGEKNYDFKQLVVYAVIKSGRLFLTYRRTPKTNEERLRDRYSLGIGGHVNTGDNSRLSLSGSHSSESFVLDALRREIREEINIKSKIAGDPQPLCFINDDSNDVGKVHFGTVWLVEIEKPEVSLRRERGIGKLEFYNLEQLQTKKQQFEKWSELLIDYFDSNRVGKVLAEHCRPVYNKQSER